MPEENDREAGPQNQQDLFTVAPPPEIIQEEIPGIVETPVPTPDPEEIPDPDTPSPVLTNNPPNEEPERKPPLIFSDVHPLPSRDGGRDASPVREKKHSSPVRRGTIHLSSGDFPSEAGFGDLLVLARKKAGLTEEQVRQITKLSAVYFSALEHSDLQNLPPPAYVAAYIRTLADVYGLDEESAALISAKLKNGHELAGDVPPALIQNLEKDGVVNEQEDLRLRRIFWLSASGLGLLLLLIIIWIIAASLGGSEPEPVEQPAVSSDPAAMEEPSGKPEFTREDFDELTTPQMPEATTLQMSRKRAIVP